MKKADVTKLNDGVKITFSVNVAKQNVVEMVQRCQSGKCDCMSDESKAKIASLEVSGEDGNVELEITGDLSADEVKTAVSKSPLIHD